MRYIIDHDLHIHSQLSLCSGDAEQNKDNILRYGTENGLKHICITDHFWDETVPGANGWYKQQDYAHVSGILPLPQAEGTVFHFGCETDMDKFFTLGISPEVMKKFEFIIVPTNHLHMSGFTIDCEKDGSAQGRAKLCVERVHALLDMDLPFEKIGLAHLTCSLLAPDMDHHDVLDLISDATLAEMLTRVAQKGAGVELNFPIKNYEGKELERELRLYRIAKDCGCKFYFGSDAHHPGGLAKAMERFALTVDALELTEDDKFRPFG